MSEPAWPDDLRPLPPGTVITTRVALDRKMAEGKLAENLLQAMIAAGCLDVSDGVWRVQEAGTSVCGIGGPAHLLLDKLKEKGSPWTS